MTTPGSKSDDMLEEDEARGHSGDEEEEEAESGVDSLEEMQKRRSIQSGRGVTLSMLMSDGILEAGEGSWAIHCKKLLNPDKKSGCGWSSMRYKGKKLDTYKNLWFRKHKQEQENSQLSSPSTSNANNKSGMHVDHPEEDKKSTTPKKWEIDKLQSIIPRPRPSPQKRIIVPHTVLGNRSFAHDLNTLVKCTPFSGLDRIQPFTVTIATNCLLLVDFHCHIIKNEVVGYLGGNWDIASHNLAVLQAFPCRSGLGDKDSAARVEDEIRRSLERRHLSVVGWYHSHPTFPAQPTIKDVDSQMEYQITMKGDSDSSYTPCLGLICYCTGWTSLAGSGLTLVAFPQLDQFLFSSVLLVVVFLVYWFDEMDDGFSYDYFCYVAFFSSTNEGTPLLNFLTSGSHFLCADCLKPTNDSFKPLVRLPPYDNQRPATEADYLAYWVMPPPEHRPHEYGRPMQMIYSIAHDSFLTQDLLMEMRLISEYYRSTGEALDFNNSFANQGSSTYWEKLQSSLRTKLPRDLMVTGAQSTAQAQAVTHFWDFLKGLIMT
ncbi:MPN domain-containing protein [Trichonephila inaurata madagascariensis]|uniref:MPN domain-containing protein n=1 Tax=Trichonephila inaurata madagascariensis TaxID=2747483 RepID=A0A8X7C982_9ARAC|nr:MPN domain-containing protein [Trichonephila inaurata madagascariensis]